MKETWEWKTQGEWLYVRSTGDQIQGTMIRWRWRGSKSLDRIWKGRMEDSVSF